MVLYPMDFKMHRDSKGVNPGCMVNYVTKVGECSQQKRGNLKDDEYNQRANWPV